MKKIFFTIVMFLCANILNAEVIKMTAYELSYKSYESYGWSDWSSWEDCNILVVINVDMDRITIYSKQTQEFDIIAAEDPYVDSDGDDVIKFTCVDADGLKCGIRFIGRSNGSAQLYCDYNDFMYVYNVRTR